MGFLFGLLAGARTFTPMAIVALASRKGPSPRQRKWVGSSPTLAILTALAAGELVGDKLPRIGSRTSPPQFAARLASGGLCAAALAQPGQRRSSVAAGMAGAVFGTVASAAARSRLAKRLGADLPAALAEDVAVLAAAAVLLTLVSSGLASPAALPVPPE